jgi:two-component system, sporulation sensor kinase A
MEFPFDQKIFISFFNLSSELMAVLTEDGRFLEASPAWEKSLGFRQAELISIPFFDLIHPEDLSKTQLEIQKLFTNLGSLIFENRLRRKDRSSLWFRWTCLFAREEGRFYLTGQDITELKEAGEALKENRFKFKRLTESTNEGIAVHDKAVILEANLALAKMFGYEKPEELIGLNGLDFATPEYHQLILNNILSGSEEPYEVIGIRKDGTRFNCLLSGKPIQYQGRSVRVSTFLDTTKIKKREQELFESQELFRKLAEASKDGIAVSERGVVLIANPALAQMFGWEVSEMIGHNALEFTAPDFRETLLKKVLEEAETTYEVMGLRKNGTRFPVEITPRMTTYQGRRVRLGFFRDITQRKKIEEEVLRQKEFSQNMINSSTDGLLAFDPECRYTLWNPAMERISGHSREEVLGQCAFDVFPFLKQIGEDAHFYGALEGKTSFAQERPYRTPAGRQGFFEAHYMPIKNAQGQILGGLGVIRDITERKKTQEALRQSELNLKAVFQNTFQNIVLMDREGRIRAFNTNAAADIKENSGKDLEIGRPLSDYVQPENAELLKRNLSRALQGEAVHLERTYRMGDGESHWFELNYHPVFGKEGEIEGICMTSLNIDDRKKSEEAVQKSEADLRAIFNSSHQLIILVGRNGKIRDFNQNAKHEIEELLGQRLEIGRLLADYVEPEFVKPFQERLKSVFKGEIVHLERTVRSRDGQDAWFEFAYNPVFDRQGKVTGACLVIASIDGRKRAEESLKESEEKFRRVFEKASIGMTLVDKNFRFAHVNRAFCDFLGYTPQELVGRTFQEVTYPDEISQNRVFAADVKNGKGFQRQKRYLHKNGSVLWANLTVSSFLDEKGELLYSLGMVEDITQKKLAEEALRKSEEELRAFFNSGSQVTILIRPDGRIQGFNKSAVIMAQRVLGRKIEKEMLFSKTLPPGASLEMFQISFNAALEGRESKGERSILSADGQERWVEVRYQPVFNDQGGVEGVCFSLVFIDERKKAEEALKESQERFERLTQVTQEGVLLHENPKVVDVNPALTLMMGYSAEEMIGKSGFDFLAPESHETARRHMVESSPEPYEVLALRKDGSVFPIELQGRNFHYKGKELRVLSVRDLTWRKETERILRESEEGYRGLVESSPQAVMVHDGEKILYVNPAGVGIFGSKRQDEVVGRSIWELVEPEYREVGRKRVLSILQDRLPTTPMEQKWRSFDGRAIEVEVKGLPLMYRGRPAIMAIIRDVTESKKNHQTLLRYERLAAVGKVIAAIAHDVRNPLTVLSGMSQILTAKLEARKEYSQELKTILAQADRLKYFMNDILDYSREMEIRKSEIDPRTILEESLVVAQSQIGAKQGTVLVEWKCAENLPRLFADGERLEQVIVNLVVNAYQAVEDNGYIRLSAKVKDGKMLLEIEDNGPGISEADMPRLFEPFFTTKREGSGLGLSISQKIAEAHGGRIEVERLKPHGTKFIVELPLEKEG